ncbi:ATPase AAA [Pseudoscardovia radai]|uniref:ATPase AAA n=2 Tax=Pseudoscardovia radai TaxID=987066 RepID=A0A261EZI0_9BIFI|nr:ATPase AAA [Pseudoscardovia radai]
MAITNRDRIMKALDYLEEGLYDVVDEAETKANGPDWDRTWEQERIQDNKRPYEVRKDDIHYQLTSIYRHWKYYEGKITQTQEAWASELIGVRNKAMHSGNTTGSGEESFSTVETLRALQTMVLLLNAVDSPDSAASVQTIYDDLERTVRNEHSRAISRRKALALDPSGAIKPWREVITPKDDVATGTFDASEFAADLYTVAVSHEARHAGNPYGDPQKFFAGTYMTEGLKDLLTRACQRLSGQTGSPVVNLQTNFGGGKTHSLLALYHLFGSTDPAALPLRVQEVVQNAHLATPWKPGSVHRVAIVGTNLHPASPETKDDGTQVNTIWGEIAWQLGGREAFDYVAEDDAKGTNPGAKLRDLLADYSPCLILIDEWVAYARQLVGRDDLPAGSFDTQFAFAQALAEAVSATPNCMLVVSIPASENGKDGASDAESIEVGGDNGKAALSALKNVISREAYQWKPSTQDESFEIVRTRLFNPPQQGMDDQPAVTAGAFAAFYKKNATFFPPKTQDLNYRQRIEMSYPLHPELLDTIYESWSSLPRFQRTRGVLSLIATMVHELWISDDASPLIMPGNMPLETDSVSTKLMQYLPENWRPIIDADIAGDHATATVTDKTVPAFGQRHVAERLARTIFMGTAPLQGLKNVGRTKLDINLGTAVPGDNAGNFGQALNTLERESTYLYDTDGRYRYDTQPSINKTAQDIIRQLKEDPTSVYNTITEFMKANGADRPGSPDKRLFERVCLAPKDTSEIPDVDEATLVILYPQYTVTRGTTAETDSETVRFMEDATKHRGNSQRTNRNMLAFLAPDNTQMELAFDTACSYLAWKDICNRAKQLNLQPTQVAQADEKLTMYRTQLGKRLAESYIWSFYLATDDPKKEPVLQHSKVTAGDSLSELAERTGARLQREDQLLGGIAPGILCADIDSYLRGMFDEKGSLSVGALWEYMTQYAYLPRLRNRGVLDFALQQMPQNVQNGAHPYALATGYDESLGEFTGLTMQGEDQLAQITDSTLIVTGEAAEASRARTQARTRAAAPSPADTPATPAVPGPAPVSPAPSVPGPAPEPKQTRFYGSVVLDPDQYNRQIAKINEMIIDQLRFSHAKMELRLDLQATQPDGFDPSIVQRISSSAETLGFTASGFDEE